MSTATAMLDPDVLATLYAGLAIAKDELVNARAGLADANERIAVLRADAIRLTSMVDSLLSQRTDLYARLNDAQADAAQWRARYMAAHDVLLCVEDFCENFLTPQGTIFMDRFFAMRAAFLAYRASIEAGAPLGWAVAEEPAEATT